MLTSYLFLADGFEEIEALATVDVLRRAQIVVATVSISAGKEVTGAHGIVVTSDISIDDCDFETADWLILPGGMPGASNLLECDKLVEALKVHNAKGGRIAAICASPGVVLAPLGIVDGKKATSYPGFEDKLIEAGAEHIAKRVVVDGNVTTGNGPSSAVPFALSIVEQTLGRVVADQVAAGMLC